jgi:hypothetical protein
MIARCPAWPELITKSVILQNDERQAYHDALLPNQSRLTEANHAAAVQPSDLFNLRNSSKVVVDWAV